MPTQGEGRGISHAHPDWRDLRDPGDLAGAGTPLLQSASGTADQSPALRLLKEHPEWTLKQVAELLGRSVRTLYRWWRSYREGGLEGLLQVKRGGGQRPVKIGEARPASRSCGRSSKRTALLTSRGPRGGWKSASASTTASLGSGIWCGWSLRPNSRREDHSRPSRTLKRWRHLKGAFGGGGSRGLGGGRGPIRSEDLA